MVESKSYPVVENRLQRKITLDEYLYELNNPDLVIPRQPNLTDPFDPLYCRKYAQNMPPLVAYRVKPPRYDQVNIEGDD